MRPVVLIVPGLVKEIWFAEFQENVLTSAGFEHTTSGLDHQRLIRLVFVRNFSYCYVSRS